MFTTCAVGLWRIVGKAAPQPSMVTSNFTIKKTAPLQERFNSFCSLYLAVDDHTLGQTLTIYVDAVEVQTCFEVGNVEVQGVLALNT